MKLGNIISKIIYVIGIISVVLVLLLNVIYVSEVSDTLDEKVTITHYGIPNLAIAVVIAIAIYELSRILKNKKTDLFYIMLAYALIQFVWINFVNVYPVTDQQRVYITATEMANRNRSVVSSRLFRNISSAINNSFFV